MNWREHGRCAEVDGDLWFPEKGQYTYRARAICRSCEVETECLEYALEMGEQWGVWGGTTVRERRQILQERRAA